MDAERIACDVAVVGAGPAGLAAAEAAGRAGARVVVLDLFGTPGGQYHMQPHPEAGPALTRGSQALEGPDLAAAATRAGADLRLGAEVFHAARQNGRFRIHAAEQGRAVVVDAAALVAATGAMERAVPFPGWTLPGVIGAGAAQRLIKTGAVAPGRKVVLAGTGPFLLAVARTFADAGHPLHVYADVARPGVSALSLLASHPGRLREAAGLVRGLLRTGARRLSGWAVVEALGTDRLEAVRLAPMTRDGVADLAKTREIDGVDTLCVGYGFRPVMELTALLGARHAYAEAAGGWHCAADPGTGATDVPGLFAAGETTGVAGAVAAKLSGRLSGAHAAAHAGANPAPMPRPAALDEARRFAAGLAALWPFPRALAAQLMERAVVCRCEDVSAAAIHAAVADGARTAGAVKMWTRAGMGPCQGRVCGPAIAGLLAGATGREPEEAGYNSPHLPLRPVGIDVVEACLSAPPDASAGPRPTA